MEDLKLFRLNEIKEKLKSEEDIFVQYIDYDREGKIFSKESLDEIDENFYKLYIFNNNFMITAFNFGDGIIKYSEIRKSDIIEESIKFYYLKKEKRLKVRIGKVKINDNESREVFQYIEIEGGER